MTMLDNIPRLLFAIMATDPDRPWCLDLFCGAGGAGMGYMLAGFNVLGVDIAPMPRYPGWFVQADALDFARQYGQLFDLIHASPVCKGYSDAQRTAGAYAKFYALDIPHTRQMLQTIGRPYVIENVSGARKHMHSPVMLCGSQFGLQVYRHRFFESNVMLFQPPHRPHNDQVPPAGQGRSPATGFFSLTSGGIRGVTQPERWMGMGGVEWMTNTELNESVPPAFTRYIGAQMLRVVQARKEAVA